MDETLFRAGMRPAAQQSPSNKIAVVSRQTHIDGAEDGVVKMDPSQTMADQKRNKMGDSQKNQGGKNDQGEIRIKYTDCAKIDTNQTVQLLYKDPGPGKSEAVEIKVNFAMAYGDTQNFSLPIYSGNFAFKCTFSRKPSEPETDLVIIDNSCHIDQHVDTRRSEKVIQNLKTIIQKAINLQIKKIQLRQDNFFKLEGQIKSIFHTRDATTAMLRLRIQDTHAHQSTQQARGHFAEFGISSANTMNPAVQKGLKDRNEQQISTYPDQNLDQIVFPEALICQFTMTRDQWMQKDQEFDRVFEQILAEEHKSREMMIENASLNINTVQDTLQELQRKKDEMTHLQSIRLEQEDQISRTYNFHNSGELQLFLQCYHMSIEKCLKAMAMDPQCTNSCFEKSIDEFAGRSCNARCRLNQQRALTSTERHVILFSMIYVANQSDRIGDHNLHPDVREQLWLRASGAIQFQKTYEGYQSGKNSSAKKDYYTALEESPCPPNPSVGTIKADQSRINFDLDVTQKNIKVRKTGFREFLTQHHMQKKFAEVMITYHKRNGAFIYNQSQSEILIRILEVVYKKETAFWLYCVLNETVLPLNFYTNTLYPQAFLEYTIKLVKNFDQSFFAKSGDAINMFCLKSYYSLFTNLSIEATDTLGKSEMAYFMLDVLFLMGDPKQSVTLLDDPVQDGQFTVGEAVPQIKRQDKKIKLNNITETRVRIDKTSQLLVAMSITIAEIVKTVYKRGSKRIEKGNDEQIRQLSGFEEIVRTSLIDKSRLLTDLLNIEIYFFSKKNNESREEKNFELMHLFPRQRGKQEQKEEQAEKWLKNNAEFGEALDKTKLYTDCRFDKRPRIKTNIETAARYLDKAKFLTKFSCFDGYMQYVDTRWEGETAGIKYEEFKNSLTQNIEASNRQSMRSNFYNNYLTEEWLVSQIECGGHLRQPICLYDFTVKTLSHDCLNFSTRHMTEQAHRFIDLNYIDKSKASSAANPSPQQLQMIKSATTQAAGPKQMPMGQRTFSGANQPGQTQHAGQEESKTDLELHDNSRTKKSFGRDEHIEYLQSLEKLPFTLDKTQIPNCLPVQRGIHLCNENFVKVFKEAYGEESSSLAIKCQDAQSQSAEFNVSTNMAQENKLINSRMIDLLYARDLVQGCSKLEGSFSNARAIAQLRQYYLRMLDPNDTLRVQQNWETQRQRYVQQVNETATNKDGAFASLPGAADVESLDAAVKLLTKQHSDLTFLSWPHEVERAHVTVHSEGRRQKKVTPTSYQKISVAKYRHIMTKDDPESIPFASIELTDTVTNIAAGSGQQAAAQEGAFTKTDVSQQLIRISDATTGMQRISDISSLWCPQDDNTQQIEAENGGQDKGRNMSVANIRVQEDYIKTAVRPSGEIQKEGQTPDPVQMEESKEVPAVVVDEVSMTPQQEEAPQQRDILEEVTENIMMETMEQKRLSLERSMLAPIQVPNQMSASQRSFQNHRPGMWGEDSTSAANNNTTYNNEQHASLGYAEPLVDGLGGAKRQSIDSVGKEQLMGEQGSSQEDHMFDPRMRDVNISGRQAVIPIKKRVSFPSGTTNAQM